MHNAEDWEELLLTEIERQQKLGKEVVFRAGAAFSKPEIYEALEEQQPEVTAYFTNRPPSSPTVAAKLAESHLTRRLFGRMVRRIDALATWAGKGLAVCRPKPWRKKERDGKGVPGVT